MDLDVRSWLRKHRPDRLFGHGGDGGDHPEQGSTAFGGPGGDEPITLQDREADAARPEPRGADRGNEP